MDTPEERYVLMRVTNYYHNPYLCILGTEEEILSYMMDKVRESFKHDCNIEYHMKKAISYYTEM